MRLFDVDKKGLAKILARRGKQWIAYELIQNAWDQNVSEVTVTLTSLPGTAKAKITVEDDDPKGFADLSHAYTLFAESHKKSDPTKAGRFNFGEKMVIAMCDEASVITTTGGVRFDRKGRHALRQKRQSGSSFEGIFACTRDELAEIQKAIVRVIPRPGIETTFNGEVLTARKRLKAFEASLQTEVADPDGNLVRSVRKTMVELFEPLPDETGMLYELGLPVVETGDRWHVNVLQKVPLTLDRENVPPAYLRRLRVEVLNQMHADITDADANQQWVREAASDANCAPEAITTVLDRRFGEKRVAYDPSDKEANSLAISQGYVVVHGGMLSGQEWTNAKAAGAIKPAGHVTPSPKPYSETGKTEDVIPTSEWTDGMRQMADYARMVAKELMGVDIDIKMTKAGNNFLACYGKSLRSGRELTFNIACIPADWFDAPYSVAHDDLLIHEFGHEYSTDHLSADYHDALTKLGAKFVEIAIYKPQIFGRYKHLA
jgi:hypothetical protein